MEYYLNHEKFLINKKSDYDQFLCVIKGSMDVAMINDTYLETVIAAYRNINFD